MPLRAVVDGRNIVAPFLSDEEWQELRQAVQAGQKAVVLPCCQVPGFLRVSHRGTRHFVHKRRGTCSWGPESEDHLRLKEVVAQAARAAGWEVTTEAAGDGWEADVLAERPGGQSSLRVAFEVQLSRQTLETTLARQERYRRSGVRGCWFFAHLPPQLDGTARQDLPAFRINRQDPLLVFPHSDSTYARVGGTWSPPPGQPLAQFVGRLLDRQVQFCTEAVRQQELVLVLRGTEIPCPHCGQMTTVGQVHLELRQQSCCGLPPSRLAIHCGYRWELMRRPELAQELPPTFISACGGGIGDHPCTSAPDIPCCSFACRACWQTICWSVVEQVLRSRIASYPSGSSIRTEERAEYVVAREWVREKKPHWCGPLTGLPCNAERPAPQELLPRLRQAIGDYLRPAVPACPHIGRLQALRRQGRPSF